MKQSLLVGQLESTPPVAALLAELGLPTVASSVSVADALDAISHGQVWLLITDPATATGPELLPQLRQLGAPPLALVSTPNPQQLEQLPPHTLLTGDLQNEAVRQLAADIREAWGVRTLALLGAAQQELARAAAGPLGPRLNGVATNVAHILEVSRVGLYACEGSAGPLYPLLGTYPDAGSMPGEIRIGAEDPGRLLEKRQPDWLENNYLVPLTTQNNVLGLLWIHGPGCQRPRLEQAANGIAGMLAVALEDRLLKGGAAVGAGADANQAMFVDKLASLGQLAAGIAHEINNPLFVISGNLEIASGMIPEMPRNLLQKALKSVERIRRIVFDMRQFYVPVSHTQRVLQINLNDLLESSIQIVGLQALFAGVTFDKDLDESISPVVGDDNQLLQVLTNLFLNAAQAMKGGGRIQVVTRQDGDRIVLQVKDNGVGISRVNLPRIFDPFFTTKQDWLGTGLGLSVTYTIVKNHGGSIDVQSEEGRGTTFTVRLPASIPKVVRPSLPHLSRQANRP